MVEDHFDSTTQRSDFANGQLPREWLGLKVKPTISHRTKRAGSVLPAPVFRWRVEAAEDNAGCGRGSKIFCHSGPSEEFIFLFTGLNRREIPRSARFTVNVHRERNDKIDFIFHSLYRVLSTGDYCCRVLFDVLVRAFFRYSSPAATAGLQFAAGEWCRAKGWRTCGIAECFRNAQGNSIFLFSRRGLFCSAVLAGCGSSKPAEQPASGPKRYHLAGRVVSVETAKAASGSSTQRGYSGIHDGHDHGILGEESEPAHAACRGRPNYSRRGREWKRCVSGEYRGNQESWRSKTAGNGRCTSLTQRATGETIKRARHGNLRCAFPRRARIDLRSFKSAYFFSFSSLGFLDSCPRS